MIRQQTLQQHPQVAQAVADLAGKISDQEMQKLNYALDGQHRDVKDVAQEFLRSKGFFDAGYSPVIRLRHIPYGYSKASLQN